MKKKEDSFAMELLKSAKEQTEKTNKRLFIIIIVLILALIGSISYTIYLLNDIGTETTITKSIDLDDINNLQDSEISN